MLSVLNITNVNTQWPYYSIKEGVYIVTCMTLRRVSNLSIYNQWETYHYKNGSLVSSLRE